MQKSVCAPFTTSISIFLKTSDPHSPHSTPASHVAGFAVGLCLSSHCCSHQMVAALMAFSSSNKQDVVPKVAAAVMELHGCMAEEYFFP